jgi:DNA-binding NtrC family response regulator
MSDNSKVQLPGSVPPPGGHRIEPPPAKNGKKKAVALPKGGRALRRSEEDIPGFDYVERMEKLGAREGESLLAFTMRIASIRAGRAFLIAFAERCRGNLSEVARQIGVNRHNLTFHIKQVGLTTEDLLRFRKPGDD